MENVVVLSALIVAQTAPEECISKHHLPITTGWAKGGGLLTIINAYRVSGSRNIIINTKCVMFPFALLRPRERVAGVGSDGALARQSVRQAISIMAVWPYAAIRKVCSSPELASEPAG